MASTTTATTTTEFIMSILGTNIPIALALLALAGQFDNHLWRIILLVIQYRLMSINVDNDDDNPTSGFVGNLLLYVVTAIVIWWRPHFANIKSRPKRGCIFVTGCDSGMGKATVLGLARSQGSSSNQYDQIFAGCYDPKTSLASYEEELTLEEQEYVTLVALDVTDNESVNEAAHTVHEWIYQNHKKQQGSAENNSPKKKGSSDNRRNIADMKLEEGLVGLTGLVQFHGVAFNGPSAYMPVEMYHRQLDVNFVGTIRVVQAMLPLLKQSSKAVSGSNGTSYRSRIVLTGTGGGSCSPCPPLLTAYMSSKFALEAYAQSLRQELYMTECKIDLSVINPGFVKPTMLIAEGTRISASMWTACESKLGSTIAKDEYGNMLDHFTKYSALQPGTHVSKIVEATEHALVSPIPRSSYKVGIDSKLAPIVGMLPTGVRELITRHGIYGILSPAGTVPGYKV